MRMAVLATRAQAGAPLLAQPAFEMASMKSRASPIRAIAIGSGSD